MTLDWSFLKYEGGSNWTPQKKLPSKSPALLRLRQLICKELLVWKNCVVNSWSKTFNHKLNMLYHKILLLKLYIFKIIVCNLSWKVPLSSENLLNSSKKFLAQKKQCRGPFIFLKKIHFQNLKAGIQALSTQRIYVKKTQHTYHKYKTSWNWGFFCTFFFLKNCSNLKLFGLQYFHWSVLSKFW